MNQRIVVQGTLCPSKVVIEDEVVLQPKPINPHQAHVYMIDGKNRCCHWTDDGEQLVPVIRTRFVRVEPWTDEEEQELRPYTWMENHRSETTVGRSPHQR